MNEFIKELIKQFKDDLQENNFRSVIYNCPPVFMQELLDTFTLANIDVPTHGLKIYADICCFLSTYFEKVNLLSIEWTHYYDLFIFQTSNNLKTAPQHFIDSLYNRGAAEVAVEQDYNGICSIMIKIRNGEGLLT